MKRSWVVLLMSLFATVTFVESLQEPAPPGFAEILIQGVANANDIIIKTIEYPASGKISCGTGEHCKPASRITWSVRNNSTSAVDVELVNFKKNGAANNPFPASAQLRAQNLQTGRRRPIEATIRNNAQDGTYKYDIVVKVNGVERARKDPELDIMR